MNGLQAKTWDDRGEQRDEVLLRTRATCAKGRPLVVTVVNLSPGGLMARSEAVLDAGDALSVELPVLGRVEVEVRWALGGRIGCRFDEPIPTHRYHRMLVHLRTR